MNQQEFLAHLKAIKAQAIKTGKKSPALAVDNISTTQRMSYTTFLSVRMNSQDPHGHGVLMVTTHKILTLHTKKQKRLCLHT